MSKFCQNCGNVMDDQEVFCANCGTQNEVANTDDTSAPIKQKISNKMLGLIAGAVAVVLVVVILFSTLSGGGAKAAVKKSYDINYKGKVSVLKGLAPKEYWNFAEEAYNIDLSEVKKDIKADIKDTIEDSDIKFSYKYQDKKEANRQTLKECKEILSERYDIDEDKIKKLYEVDFTFTTKFDGDKDISTHASYAVKIGAKWYPVDDDGNFIVNDIVFTYKDDKTWAKYLEKNSKVFDSIDFDYDDYDFLFD